MLSLNGKTMVEESKMRIRLSSKGQVVLPAEIRRRYRLCAGSELELVDAGDHLVIRPPAPDPVLALKGMLPSGPGQRSLVAALLESRRSDVERE